MRVSVRMPWLPKRIAAATIVVTLSTPFFCGSIREDEFLCNEAIAHVRSCCGGATVPADFCEFTSGCDGGGHSPSLSPSTSRCLLAEDCGALRQRCATWTSTSSTTGRVCP
jgi:hypothetical protein